MFDEQQQRFSKKITIETYKTGFFGKLLVFVLGTGLLVAGLLFSVLVFAALIVGGCLLWGILWWKTRDIRKQMREHPPGGRVIDGELGDDSSVSDDERQS